jgi:hypothetical protein
LRRVTPGYAGPPSGVAPWLGAHPQLVAAGLCIVAVIVLLVLVRRFVAKV